MPSMNALVRRLLGQRWVFTLAYRSHHTPWDTNVTPPELVRVVEGAGPEHLPTGRALDLGCGTGTNSLYLARHGWEVVGIDFIAAAIDRAREKYAAAGSLAGTVEFRRGDVTRLQASNVLPGSNLIFDLGCFHGLSRASRAPYVAGISGLAASGATLLLYAFGPTMQSGRAMGLTREELAATFAPGWVIARVEQGSNPDGRAAAWYWLTRTDGRLAGREANPQVAGIRTRMGVDDLLQLRTIERTLFGNHVPARRAPGSWRVCGPP